MKVTTMRITRRAWGRILAGAALGGGCGLGDPGPLTWQAETVSGAGQERRYRANAQVLLFGLPLVHWPNVGGGSAAWREPSGSGGRLRHLEFTGFSNPERAGGLNRLGFLRELSREAGATNESIYFGLMTASPEETAEEARKALHPTGKTATYTAIEGHLTDGAVETAVAYFTAPAQWSMGNQNELMDRARAALAGAARRPPEGDTRGPAMRPFLHALAGALGKASPTETRFSYAGRPYRLWLEKAADAKATALYQKRGLLAAGGTVVRASGRVRREAGGKESNFRVWVEEGAAKPIPLRIEYQAKSYLRLVFETEG